MHIIYQVFYGGYSDRVYGKKKISPLLLLVVQTNVISAARHRAIYFWRLSILFFSFISNVCSRYLELNWSPLLLIVSFFSLFPSARLYWELVTHILCMGHTYLMLSYQKCSRQGNVPCSNDPNTHRKSLSVCVTHLIELAKGQRQKTKRKENGSWS